MDSHQWNKIIGSVLGTILFVLVVRAVGEAIFFAEEPEEPAIKIAGSETAPAEGRQALPPAESLPDFAAAIPAADAMAGGMIAERCMVCHGWDKGGPAMIGPNLYGVVGTAEGHGGGFRLLAGAQGKGRQLDLRGPVPLPPAAGRVRAGHEDGLRRIAAEPGPAEPDRVPADAGGHAGRAAGGQVAAESPAPRAV